MRVLVTGGAGYIGSVTVKRLLEVGHEVIVFDNLHQGHKESLTCPLIVGDLLNKKDLFEKLSSYNFDSVIHFAAYALAGESMEDPYRYFQNNLMGGLNLLEFMKERKVPSIVFSSTCAIYGTPLKVPVIEEEPKKPESVYGESKLMFENVLKWYGQLYGITYINLRYFNACGASIDGKIGEEHDPETHIIPVAIHSLLSGKPFKLFGTDYPNPDGTCIRDYIHIEDLAQAHIQALQKLMDGGKNDAYNLGTGHGYSNREVLNMIEKVSGKKLQIIEKPRRPGDPPIIFADNTKAKRELGFNPKYSDLETIIKSAWEWHTKHQ